MQTVPRIFVSATSRDLRTARGLVSEGLRRMECLPIVQDDFPPDYKSVRDMLRTKIKDCNAVVHLAGFYYGAEPQPVIPGPDRRSFTQMEYEIAMELKLPCYVFLCGKLFPFDQHDPEPEEKQALQMAHRDRLLKRDELFYEFATPEELANRTRELQLSVEGLRGELAKERLRRRSTLAACIVLFLIGGSYFYTQMQKSDAVIAETTVQLQKQGDLIAQLLAEQARLRGAVGGTTEQIVKQAEENVAKANNQSVAEVRLGAGKALADAKAEVAAAGEDKSKLLPALKKLMDAEVALGHDNEAIVVLQQRIALLDREKDPEIWAQASEELSTKLNDRGSYDEGLKIVREAFEWAKTSKIFGPEHPTTLRLMLRVAGQSASAKVAQELAQFVVKIRERDLGPEHADTLAAMTTLAGKIPSQEESEALFRRVINVQTKTLGAEHKDTLSSSVILAKRLQGTFNDYTAAAKLLEKVLEIRSRTLGPEHPETATAISILANLREQQKDYTAAIKLRRQALAIRERTDGPDGKDTLIAVSNLALLLSASNGPGELDEAIALNRRGLETEIRTLGPGQKDTLISFWNLAIKLEKKGDKAGAKALFLRAIDELEKAVGQTDTVFLRQLSETIEHFRDGKDYASALQLAQRHLKIREATLPEGDTKILSAMVDVANLQDDVDNITEAVRLTRLVIELRERKQPEQKVGLAGNYNNLSYFLGRLGEQAEALTQMRKCVEISLVAFEANDKTRLKYEERLKRLESEATAPLASTGTKATASKSDKAAPSTDDYADFRMTVSDKIKSEQWRKVEVTLPESKSGREPYLLAWFDGTELRKILHVDSADDDNETLNAYYWSEGWITSVWTLRQGSDEPTKGVDSRVDVSNFLREKLVHCTVNSDGKEETMDVEDPDVSKTGQSIIELGNELKGLVLEEANGASKTATPTPVVSEGAKPLSLEEYIAFQDEVDRNSKSAGWKEVKQDLPGTGDDRRVYLLGWFEGKMLRRLLSVDAEGKESGTFKNYYWTPGGQFLSAHYFRKGSAVMTKGAATTTDIYNYHKGKFVGGQWSLDDRKHVTDPNSKAFANMAAKVIEEAGESLGIIRKAFTDGPAVMTAGKSAAPTPEKAPPSLQDYVDFRMAINDKVKAGGFKSTTLNLPAENGRTHYIEGEWNGDKMERAFESDEKDEENKTTKLYYFNQHGVLMSIYRVRKGADVGDDKVKTATDTFNFYDGVLVSWKYTRDQDELVMDPKTEGFEKIGSSILEIAKIHTEKLLKAGPKPQPAPVPNAKKLPSEKEYADFRAEIRARGEAGKHTETKMDLPAKSGREHYIQGSWLGDKLEMASEWNAVDSKNGTFTFYYFNQHGILMSIFRTREGVDSPVDGVKVAKDTFNFSGGQLVGWTRIQDDASQVEDPSSKGYAERGREELEAGKKVTADLIKAGPK